MVVGLTGFNVHMYMHVVCTDCTLPPAREVT